MQPVICMGGGIVEPPEDPVPPQEVLRTLDETGSPAMTGRPSAQEDDVERSLEGTIRVAPEMTVPARAAVP